MKKLKISKKKNSGRNFQGHITVRHKGGGFYHKYILVDFKRDLFDLPSIVMDVTYDANRTAFIALLLYKNGMLSYIIATSFMKVGAFLLTSESAQIVSGNALPLSSIPLGSIINNIELHFGKGSQLCRSAGSFGILISKYTVNSSLILVKLKSKEEYFIYSKCLAVIGIVSNIDHFLKNLKKAGVSRNLGKRPTVRGVAMNPVDHPHGGGEGKTSGGRPSVSKWSRLTKGKRTKKKNLKNKFIFSSRRLFN